MHIYELINPSDAYTFEASCDGVAAIVAGMCGAGYGACRDGWQAGPFLFGDFEQTIKDDLDGLSLDAFIEQHRRDIGAALVSFRIGEREDYPSEETGIDALIGKRRTSMNNVGAWARKKGLAMLAESEPSSVA